MELDHECKSDLDTKQKCLPFNPAWTIFLLLYCFYCSRPSSDKPLSFKHFSKLASVSFSKERKNFQQEAHSVETR